MATWCVIAVVQFQILFVGINLCFCKEIERKTYRKAQVQEESQSSSPPLFAEIKTVLSPTDKLFLAELDRIEQTQREKGNQSFARVVAILKETDSNLVAQNALICLRCFYQVPLEILRELYPLAFCDDRDIKAILAHTLTWFGYSDSLATLFILASDADPFVVTSATTMLCHFGIEGITALPFIKKNTDSFDYNPLFLAKVIRHISFQVFLGAGIQFLPSAKRVRVIVKSLSPKGVWKDETLNIDLVNIRDTVREKH